MKMKFTNRLLITSILLASACSSCAREDSTAVENNVSRANSAPALITDPAMANEPTEVRLEDDGSLLIFTSKGNGPLKGSLISMTDGDSELRHQRIMLMLNALPVDKDFVAKMDGRLKVNRRLKQETFVLPLVDEKGNTHNFEYISNTKQHLYTLNYRFEKAAE